MSATGPVPDGHGYRRRHVPDRGHGPIPRSRWPSLRTCWRMSDSPIARLNFTQNFAGPSYRLSGHNRLDATRREPARPAPLAAHLQDPNPPSINLTQREGRYLRFVGLSSMYGASTAESSNAYLHR